MDINRILLDFRRRYEHSYLHVQHPGGDEESLFYVNQITDDRTKIATLELTSPEYGKIILNMGTAHTLRFKYPPVGVFQNGVDAYLFRRRTAKQYKFGLCPGNSLICPVYNTILGRQVGREAALEFHDVLAAYQAERYSFADALKMLGSGKYRSVALQRNFSLMLSTMDDQNYLLLYWETPVASIDREGNVNHLYEKQFEAVVKQAKES